MTELTRGAVPIDAAWLPTRIDAEEKGPRAGSRGLAPLPLRMEGEADLAEETPTGDLSDPPVSLLSERDATLNRRLCRQCWVEVSGRPRSP